MMRWPWVSRALYDVALEQIKELKESNAQLLNLALTKQAEPEKTKDEEDTPPPTRRRLVKEIRETAEAELRLKAKSSGKPIK